MNGTNGTQALQNFSSREELIKAFADEFLKKLADDANLARKLVSNTDYILWLQEFTFTHPSFGDFEWQYFPERIEPENLDKVKLLGHFFEGIEMYTEDSIKIPEEFGYSIKISFNNIGYQIGVRSGQGTYYYCERCEISHNESDFIDFGEIMKKANQ